MPNEYKVKRAARYLVAYFKQNGFMPSRFKYGGVTTTPNVVRWNKRIIAFTRGSVLTMVNIRYLRKSMLKTFTIEIYNGRHWNINTVNPGIMATAIKQWRNMEKGMRKYGTVVMEYSDERTAECCRTKTKDMVLNAARSYHSHDGWDIRKLDKRLRELILKYGGDL